MLEKKMNRSGLGSLLAAIAGMLLVACATPGVLATTNVYVASSNGGGTVYKIPSNFGGAAVTGSQVLATVPSAYSLATVKGDPNLYIAQLAGGGADNIYRRNLTTGADPDGGSAYISSGVSIFDIGFADSDDLQVVGPQNVVKVYNSGTHLGDYSLSATSTLKSGGIYYNAALGGVYITTDNGSAQDHVGFYTGTGASYTDSTPSGLASQTSPLFLQQVTEGPGPDGVDLYVTSFSADNGIYRVNPTTGASTLLVGGAITPVGIAMGTDGLLYFTDYKTAGSLYSFNLTTNTLALVATGLDHPSSIAFEMVPEPASLGLLGIGALALLPRRRRR